MTCCKKCGQPIKWINYKGYWKPYNVSDKKLHLINCKPDPDYEAKIIEEKEIEEELENWC